MKPVNGYNEAKVYTDFTKLPAGAYVVGILDAEEFHGEKGDRLIIKFDICEGDFKNYYTEQFKNSQFEDAKYKGNYSIFIPKEDGSEEDAKTLRRLKTNIANIEESNPGFHWDWDERKLKGKKVGMIFQDKEWAYNNKTGVTAQPYGLCSVEDARSGKCKIPDKKLLQGASLVADGFTIIGDSDDDLPF